MASKRTPVSNAKKGTDSKANRASNVKVVVRVRPTNFQEKEGGFRSVVRVIDEHMLVFDPKCDSENNARLFGRAPPKSRSKPARGNILDRRVKDLQFVFDRVFDERSSNQEVFENTTSSVIDSVLEGFNCSVFAYGATSAGKTHTMLGSPNKPGVIFLTMMELYMKIEERKEEFSCEVSVSYLEIYNETARDLLVPNRSSLAVREDPQKGVCVTGLSVHKPKSAEEILGMLESGNQNRTQHPTDANKQSSRSHAVFQVFVRQQPKSSGLSTDVKYAKMSLIDLAGSERGTVTTNRGARLREGANINRSLLALGNCINALADNKTVKGKKDVHIPYRDSKLTRLLKDSLGGNCKTIMIAALSPSSMCYEDTYNTLKYANRAKEIKSTLTSNVISVDFHVTKYAKIVEELKQQVEDLKSKVTRYESGEATPMKQQKLRCTQRDQLVVIQDELSGVYKSRCLIRKQIIDCEAAEKELKIKLFKKERNNERIQLVRDSSDNAVEESIRKLERFRVATKIKQTQFTEKTQSLVKQLAGNDEKIAVLKSRADEWLSTVVDESLKDSYIVFQEARMLEVEKVSARAQARHLRRYMLLQEKDSQLTERLVSTLLGLVHKLHKKVRAHDIPAPQLDQDFSALLADLEGSRRITWADESTRECLDVTSIMNFTSCTPIQTPARKKCVLQNETPKNGGRSEGGAARNLDSIAAMNSLINSKRSFLDEGRALRDTMGSISEASQDAISQNLLMESTKQVGEHSLPRVSMDETLILQSNAAKDISITATGVERQETMLLLPRRRALELECDGASEPKISRLDDLVLPDVPFNDDLELLDLYEERGSSPETSFVCAADLQDKERRGTMVINKSIADLISLPIIGSGSSTSGKQEGSVDRLPQESTEVQSESCSASSNKRFSDDDGVKDTENKVACEVENSAVTAPSEVSQSVLLHQMEASSVLKSSSNKASNGLVSNLSNADGLVTASLTKKDDEVGDVSIENSDVKSSDSEAVYTTVNAIADDITAVNTAANNAKNEATSFLNATFDVNHDVHNDFEATEVADTDENAFESTFVLSTSKKPNLDLSGVEPIVDSPRQPLADICKNKLNGSMLTQQTASLHLHGLPSMRDNSNFKIKPQITCKDASEVKKPDAKDHKSPFSSAKANRSRYAAVSSRLYNENPRYASATIANKMKSRSEKKYKPNSLNNPIRLRETRRRSRTSSSTTGPYSAAMAKRHGAGTMLGIRKTAEQMGGLKGLKASKNFMPTSVGSVLNNMPSSAI